MRWKHVFKITIVRKFKKTKYKKFHPFQFVKQWTKKRGEREREKVYTIHSHDLEFLIHKHVMSNTVLEK